MLDATTTGTMSTSGGGSRGRGRGKLIVTRVDGSHTNITVGRRLHRQALPKVFKQNFRDGLALGSDRIGKEKDNHSRKSVPFLVYRAEGGTERGKKVAQSKQKKLQKHTPKMKQHMTCGLQNRDSPLSKAGSTSTNTWYWGALIQETEHL